MKGWERDLKGLRAHNLCGVECDLTPRRMITIIRGLYT